MKKIQKWINIIYLFFYTVKPLVKYALNGWYVFRDSSDWVVKKVSEINSNGDDLDGFLIQAKNEAKLRGIIK